MKPAGERLEKALEEISVDDLKVPVVTNVEAEVNALKVNVTYFETGGPAQTDETLRLAADRAKALGIEHIVIPTTSG
jgi:hypothetical protein